MSEVKCEVIDGVLDPCREYYSVLIKDGKIKSYQSKFYLKFIGRYGCPKCGVDFRQHTLKSIKELNKEVPDEN